jgi:hypothetical protein
MFIAFSKGISLNSGGPSLDRQLKVSDIASPVSSAPQEIDRGRSSLEKEMEGPVTKRITENPVRNFMKFPRVLRKGVEKALANRAGK